jgi:hypothetical protein
VLDYAAGDPNLAHLQVRISVLDEYKHVKERLTAKGYSPFYPNGAFQTSPEQFDAVRRMLEQVHAEYGFRFETCAEPALGDSDAIEHKTDSVCVPLPKSTHVYAHIHDGRTVWRNEEACAAMRITRDADTDTVRIAMEADDDMLRHVAISLDENDLDELRHDLR